MARGAAPPQHNRPWPATTLVLCHQCAMPKIGSERCHACMHGTLPPWRGRVCNFKHDCLHARLLACKITCMRDYLHAWSASCMHSVMHAFLQAIIQGRALAPLDETTVLSRGLLRPIAPKHSCIHACMYECTIECRQVCGERSAWFLVMVI